MGTFQDLGPDRVLTLVERTLGVRLNNLLFPCSSYINRVFEVEDNRRKRYIVKFYRPGRWSKEAILDEHRFLKDLSKKELPIIAPLNLSGNTTLAEDENIFFAVFPKFGGRSVDEFSEEEWGRLGRLIGRVHQVGESRKASHRLLMSPQGSTSLQLKYLQESPVVPKDVKKSLTQVAGDIIKDISPLFAQIKPIRIHGDCHFANIIVRPKESLYLLDFDDMVMGPPVQDIWMLLPGEVSESGFELEAFLEGYETFRTFDRRSLQLIEPLRAMRYIHYLAWCVHQVAADGETRVVDGFGSREYWQRELADLADQRARIGKKLKQGQDYDWQSYDD